MNNTETYDEQSGDEMRAEFHRKMREIDAQLRRDLADIPRRTAQMWADAEAAFAREYWSWPWWKRWAYNIKGLFVI